MYDFIVKIADEEMGESPYYKLMTITKLKSGAVSVIFNGVKPFDIKETKSGIMFSVRKDFLKHCDIEGLGLLYIQSELSSQPDFIKITVSEQFVAEKFISHFFRSCHSYFDIIYIPKDGFACCHRFNECSDAKKCTHPDFLHAKGCSYRQNLEAGNIFYGKNRNI